MTTRALTARVALYRRAGRDDLPTGRAAIADGAMLLSAGTIVSGILAYAFNVLVARTLGPEEYGPIAALWAAVFIAAVVLFRPIEQTLSRSIAERCARGTDVAVVLRSVARLAVIVCACAVAVCLLAWPVLTDRLFAGRDDLTLALVGAIVAYCASYVVRGVVSGIEWLGGYGLLLLADGAVRLLVALPLLLFASPTIAAAALVLAALAGALAPLIRNRALLRAALRTGEGADFKLRSATRFAGPVTLVAASEQILVGGGPILIMVAGGEGAAAAAGVVFAATMLVRAPVFLFQGFSAALLPGLTRLDAHGDRATFRAAVWRSVVLLPAFSALLVIMAVTAGPEVMAWLYGDGFAVARGDLAILCVGIGFYLVAATLSQAILARGRAGVAGASWAAAAVLFVVLELVLIGEPMHRVSVAFASASALMAALLVAAAVRDRMNWTRG